MKVPLKIQEKWLLYQATMEKSPEAFGKLYDGYATRIYRFIYFKVSSSTDAEDLTAEVFLKAWQYLSEGKEIRSFSGLLYTIARNQVIDFYRRGTASKEPKLEDMELENLSDGGKMKEGLEKMQEATALVKKLKLLKDEYREVLTLRYIDELAPGEIAEILNKSGISVRVLIHRALKALKKIIEKSKNLQ